MTVLKHEAVEGLAVQPSGDYEDCTLGGGGHSLLILQSLNATGKLIAFDQDKEAIAHAEKLFAEYKEQVRLINSNFRYLQDRLQDIGIEVDGVLFRFGVSSHSTKPNEDLVIRRMPTWTCAWIARRA